MVLPCDEHLGLLAAPLAVVASKGAEEECKRTVERNLQGTNVDNLPKKNEKWFGSKVMLAETQET